METPDLIIQLNINKKGTLQFDSLFFLYRYTLCVQNFCKLF